VGPQFPTFSTVWKDRSWNSMCRRHKKMVKYSEMVAIENPISISSYPNALTSEKAILGQSVYTFLSHKHDQLRQLTEDEVRYFKFYGCVLVEDAFLPQEVELLQKMTEEVLNMPDSTAGVTLAFEKVPLPNHDTDSQTMYQQRVCRVEGFIPRHPGFAAISRDRLAPLAAQLLGEDCHLFKEKLNIKHGNGGGGYAAHFDGPSAASVGLAARFVTAQLAIDDQSLENGTLQVVMPRSACPWFDDEKSEEECAASVMMQPTDADPDAGGRVGAILPDVAASLDWQAVPCRAGSVLLFDGYFPHKSAPNYSDGARRTAYFLFNGDSDGGDCHDAYKQVMAARRRAAAAKSTVFKSTM